MKKEDAGREGELIFRLVYNQARCKKHFERLWISSTEDSAIREGFEKLKPGTQYDLLYEAALCRERADWIVGMNAILIDMGFSDGSPSVVRDVSNAYQQFPSRGLPT